MKTEDIYLKVMKKDIVFLCNFLESFEGMMTLRTPNPDRYSDTANIHINIAPDYQDQFNIILNNLKKDVFIEETEI